MSEPFVGEIRMFAGNFAPRNWALCDGQLLPISSNDALFSLIGTLYGGDGRTTFALPDLRGRVPLHMGQGPGLTDRRIGSRGGSENTTLTPGELPVHNHPVQASTDPATSGDPGGNVVADAGDSQLYNSVPGDIPDPGMQTSQVGGSQQHTNVMPFQCVHFIICLFGIYPSRN